MVINGMMISLVHLILMGELRIDRQGQTKVGRKRLLT
jgi:hypothetical protein